MVAALVAQLYLGTNALMMPCLSAPPQDTEIDLLEARLREKNKEVTKGDAALRKCQDELAGQRRELERERLSSREGAGRVEVAEAQAKRLDQELQVRCGRYVHSIHECVHTLCLCSAFLAHCTCGC